MKKVRLINFHCIVRYMETAEHGSRYCFVRVVKINLEYLADVLDLVTLR
jgi:hypothetical protein